MGYAKLSPALLAPTALGLTVSRDSKAQLLLGGSPFMNLGANLPDAFFKVYGQTNPTGFITTSGSDQDTALTYLWNCGVRVIRVMLFPFYPNQWKATGGILNGHTYATVTLADRTAYYTNVLDPFIAKCRAKGMGIIPSFFWNGQTICDVCGETRRGGWMTNGSNTRALATTLTQEVVARYLTEPAIYGWEFSNEFNQDNNQNGAGTGNTAYGQPATYPANQSLATSQDGVTSDFQHIMAWWNDIVQSIDPNRIVVSGNGPCGFMNSDGFSYISHPLPTWLKEIIRDNPTNCAEIDFYGGIQYLDDPEKHTLDAMLCAIKTACREVGKAFICKEFINDTTVTDTQATRWLTAAAKSGVPSFIWAYYCETEAPSTLDMSAKGGKASQAAILTAANATLPTVPTMPGYTPPAAPVNTTLPTSTGTPQVGVPFVFTRGVWSNTPTSYTEQVNLAGVAISGATSLTYTPVTGDVGSTLTITENASNGTFGTAVTSAATPAVIAAASNPIFQWSTTDKASGITISNSNKTATFSGTNTTFNNVRGSVGKSSGGWGFRVKGTTINASGIAGNNGIGIANSSASLVNPNYMGINNNAIAYYDDGSIYRNGAVVGNAGSFASNAEIDVFWNRTTNLIWFRKVGGLWNGSSTADPASGTGGISISAVTGTVYPAATLMYAAEAFVAESPPTISGFTSLS